MVRYPVGGLCWHHLQYLVGLKRLGHHVTFFEDHGWDNSCYDPVVGDMANDPTYGWKFLTALLAPHGLQGDGCYLRSDGSTLGIPRQELAQRIREADVVLNLSNMNWIPEMEHAQRRVLVDTDPTFTQLGFGKDDDFKRDHARFTYGENVHRAGCDMPTAGVRWLPTRQPVVLDLWPHAPGPQSGPFTSVLSWTAYGDREMNGRVYGQKDREFKPFMRLPSELGLPMTLAVNGPDAVKKELGDGGWEVIEPLEVTRTPQCYQAFISQSRAEFCVAKHGYVSTRSGWFSDRSTAYMAMGRPIVVQDTGFSDFLPVGQGLLAWRTPAEAKAALTAVCDNYPAHCAAARAIVEEHFSADKVLTQLLQQAV